MISIRRARPTDAPRIGEIHAEVWRSAYAGILPAAYLSGLSSVRLAGFYRRAVADRREGHAMFVALVKGEGGSEVVGFVSGARARRPGIAEGEIETLYLLEEWRECGVGRRLMRAMAAHLAAIGCRSAMVWVLANNPARWFYQRLGGRETAREVIRVGGAPVEQAAYLWDPIETLLAATTSARGEKGGRTSEG